MTIPLPILQQFKQESAFVRTNQLLPILSYIRFGDGKIIKNNLHQFVSMDCPESDTLLLVDEKILLNLLGAATGDITISATQKKVTLTDENITISHPFIEAADYPLNNSPEDEWQSLPCTDSISVASKFIDDDPTLGPKSHVFVGNKHVAATDGFIGYLETVGEVPKIVMDKITASKVGGLQETEYAQNASYNFFRSKAFIYGFAKSEYPFFDLTPLMNKSEQPSFNLTKESLIKFNDVAVGSGSKIPVCEMHHAEGKLICSMNDKDFDIDIHQGIEATGSATQPFRYNAILLNRLLKSVPDSSLSFTQSQHRYFITGEGFTALIQEII